MKQNRLNSYMSINRCPQLETLFTQFMIIPMLYQSNVNAR